MQQQPGHQGTVPAGLERQPGTAPPKPWSTGHRARIRPSDNSNSRRAAPRVIEQERYAQDLLCSPASIRPSIPVHRRASTVSTLQLTPDRSPAEAERSSEGELMRMRSEVHQLRATVEDLLSNVDKSPKVREAKALLEAAREENQELVSHAEYFANKADQMKERGSELIGAAEQELQKVRREAAQDRTQQMPSSRGSSERRYSLAAPDLSDVESTDYTAGAIPTTQLPNGEDTDIKDASEDLQAYDPRSKLAEELRIRMSASLRAEEQARLREMQEQLWEQEVQKQRLSQTAAIQQAEISQLRYELAKRPPVVNHGFHYIEADAQLAGSSTNTTARSRERLQAPTCHPGKMSGPVVTISSKFQQARNDAWNTLLEMQPVPHDNTEFDGVTNQIARVHSGVRLELAHREMTRVYNQVAAGPSHVPVKSERPDHSKSMRAKQMWHKAPMMPGEQLQHELASLREVGGTLKQQLEDPVTSDFALRMNSAGQFNPHHSNGTSSQRRRPY